MIDVPTDGIVINVGRKVPRMLPTVLNAFNMPTVFPLSVRLSIVYLTKEGVTVPSKNNGNTKIAIQAKNPDQIKK